MRNIIIALLLAAAKMAVAAPIPPVGCPNCILNTASPQNAEINIGTGTIRGTLTVSTLTATNLVITNLTATQFIGGGAGLTSLNATQLLSGTVPSARLVGAYTGITSVGTIAAGVWNGTAIATQYGGTGQNFAAVNRGALPFFNGTGTMSTLAAGTANKVLQTNGSSADPTWTAAPTVLGTNVSAIPLANLVTGNLPSAIKATDSSLVSVSGSKIVGDIGGNAGNITGTLPIGQLGAGTLAADVLAQTLNNIGTPAGTWGGATLSAQITTNNQGRVTNITQFSIPGVSTRTAWIDQDNNWHGAAQTSQSSWTIKSDLLVTGTLTLSNPIAVTSGGTGKATLTTHGLVLGQGTAAVAVLPAMGPAGLVIGNSTGADPSTGTLTGTAQQVVVTRTGAGLVLSGPQDLGTGSSPTFAALTLTAPLTTANGGSGQNWSATAAGGLPYFNGTGALGVLPKSTNGYTLTQVAGVPAWAAASSSATSLSGGALGSLPYQSEANVTAMLAAGTGVLQESGAAPAWTLTPTLTGTNFTSIPPAAINAGSLRDGVTISTQNVVPGFNGASNLVQMTVGGLYPAASGVNITALTAANISAGTAGINISGNAATVTTNANLTGGVTSVGNAATVITNANLTGGVTSVGNAATVVTNANLTGGVTSVGNAATVITNANLTGDVTSVGNATTLTNAPVIAKVLTGYSSGAGTVSATDSILQAIQKLNGNDATNANLTGNVTSVGNATTIAVIPAVSGAALTNLTAANIAAGTAGIDISGNAATATKATNITGGLVGKIPYQSAADTTLFLPAMGAGGIITGNGTSAVPSTGTLTGTSNQVVITRTNSNIVLSGPQDLGTGSSPTFVTVTAALSGNATTATSATTATNLAGGGAGQLPYQSAAGTTLFLPAMTSMGIVLGNAAATAPSTVTLQGTANQVVITRAATTLTLSTPQSINSGATPTFTGTNFTGIPESGVTSLTTDLGLKAALAGATFTGASGITNVAFTATGANGNIITAASSTASAFFGDGSHLTGISVTGGHAITTGTLIAGATPYPTQNQLRFDSAYFVGTDSTTGSFTFLSLSTATGQYSTRQTFTSGTSQTYTRPNGVSQIKVRMVGGGGGGSGQSSGNGATGVASSFNGVVANAGVGATASSPSSGGGIGGTGGTGTATLRIGGGAGGTSHTADAGGGGGNSAFGGGGIGGSQLLSQLAGAGATNSGAGGGGGARGVPIGAGGGAGEYVELVINSPSPTYTYTVGTGGAAGDASGGAGAAGIIIVEEFYNTVINNGGWTVPASSQTVNGWPSATGSNGTFGASIPGSTVTIVTNGGDVDYQFTGSCRLDGTSNRMGLVVYQDGAVSLPAKLSGSTIDGTNTVGDLGMGSAATATVESNCSFTKTFRSVPAGTHSYSIAAAVNSGNWSMCGTYGACSAIAREVKMAAGTGDAGTNGNNNWTGINTGIVISSFTIRQTAWTTTATSGGVCLTGSTVAYTSLGSGNLDVILSATCQHTAAQGTNTWCTVLQDGGALAPYVAGGTTGPFPFDAHVPNSNLLYPCGFHINVPGPSAGSHSYCLSCFSGSGTYTIGNTTRGPATFGVREYH